MKTISIARRDPLTRLALWFYVAKRAVVFAGLVGAPLLAGFLVFAAFARQWLVKLGV